MPTNDFLPFGTGAGANVMPQSDYQALAARISGFQAGTAASAQLNKAWRQASVIACTLAQFIADQSGQNSVDDGTTATLQANLLTAIRAAGRQATILADTGAVNAYAAVNAPALSALPATGYGQRITIANANTGPSTYAPDGLAARPIYGLGLKPLQGGELPVGVAILMYLVQPGVNGGNGAWIIIESLGGASQVANATQSQHAVALGQLPVLGLIRSIKRQGFAASGVYTPSPGMVFCDVEQVGGGGGGGGSLGAASSSGAGGGGGAGSYTKKIFTAAQIGQSQVVTIGAAGIGGQAGNNRGTTGGTTSLGALLVCDGGTGGGGSGASSGVGGVSSFGGSGGVLATGDLNLAGGSGSPGFTFSSGSGGFSGAGANSQFGSGGYPAGPSGSGNTGTGRGSGGSGGATTSSSAIGGSGTQGIMIITEYCTQ